MTVVLALGALAVAVSQQCWSCGGRYVLFQVSADLARGVHISGGACCGHGITLGAPFAGRVEECVVGTFHAVTVCIKNGGFVTDITLGARQALETVFAAGLANVSFQVVGSRAMNTETWRNSQLLTQIVKGTGVASITRRAGRTRLMASLTDPLGRIKVVTFLANDTVPVNIYLMRGFALRTLGATLTFETILSARLARFFIV